MNDCSIGSKRHIDISIGGVSFTKWLLWWSDCIFIQFDTKIILPLATDISIHIQNKSMAEVSVRNDIIVSVWVV